MSPDEVDDQLARLKSAAEAATANLIELEDMGTLTLMRAGSFKGASAAPIAHALAEITALNLNYSCFMAFAKEIEGLATEGHVNRDKARQIERLMRSPSIELPAVETDFEARDLFSPIERVEMVTPDRLIDMMNAEFMAAKAVVLRVDSIWHGTSAELDRAERRLRDLAAAAESLGEPTAHLDQIKSRIQWCRAALTEDPFSADDLATGEIGSAIGRIEHQLRAVAAERHGLAGELSLARQRLRGAIDALDACDDFRAEALRAIAGPPGLLAVERRYVEDPRTGLGPWLDRLEAMQAGGRWRDARNGLAHWNDQAAKLEEAAQRALDANRAPLARRDELRGMLSAYEVVARQQGRASDPPVIAGYTAAASCLYREPVDLDEAEALVSGFTHAVRGQNGS